jgi:CRISPR type IV-associated protein Csf3
MTGMLRIKLYSPLAFWANKTMYPLSLDGILAYVVALREGKWKTPAEITKGNFDPPELPLDKVDDIPGLEFYKASMMFVPPEAYWSSDTFVKKSDAFEAMHEHGVGSPNILRDKSQGIFRGGMEPFLFLNTPYVDFYFSGDYDAVVDLKGDLERLGYIGAKHNAGCGAILKIRVKHIKDPKMDYSVFKDGRPTRPIPVEYFPDGLRGTAIERCGFRPPYEYVGSKARCYVPPPEQWYPQMQMDSVLEQIRDASSA